MQITITDPITQEVLGVIERPASDRLFFSSDDAQGMKGLWLAMDAQEVDGLRVSLVGSSARNLIVDATGGDLSGAQFILDAAKLLNTRVQARDTDPDGLVLDQS